MACGKPIVNTAIERSGVPYVSRDGESGLTVPPHDAEAFSRAVRMILTDRALSRRFGEAGRARVKNNFSKEVMAQRILSIYRQTTETERRTAPAPIDVDAAGAVA
jgi:glycosyltransferase involved in cell wall biosynthesis